MANLCATLTLVCCLISSIHAIDEGLSRESKFIKLVPNGDVCFAGITELEKKIILAEEKLLKVVEIFRKLMMSVSAVSSSRTGGSCEGAGNYSFTPNNSADLDNSNRIHNRDEFVYNNLDQLVSGVETTESSNQTTTVRTITTTQPTVSCDCADVTSFLNGRNLTTAFPSFTSMMDNSPEKCAAFCLLWGYSTSVISAGLVCYCTNESIFNLCGSSITTPAPVPVPVPTPVCNAPCPGRMTSKCGGLANPFVVSIHPSNIVNISRAYPDYFPNGKCYALNPTFADPDKRVTDPLLIPTITPEVCKAQCNTYKWSCISSGFCLCFNSPKGPTMVSPFQDYCLFPCPGMPMAAPNITCGSFPAPAILAANCIKLIP